MPFLWEYFRYLISGPNLLHQGFSTLMLLLMSVVESMQLKTISLVPFNLLWECVCGLTLIHDLLSQFIPYWCYYGRLFADPILLLLFSHGSYQRWFVNVSKFSWHKFKQQFTIITDLITKEDGLDETPGSHLSNSRIACKVLRIYFLTLMVHFPLARATVALEFCCVGVWSCEWQGFVGYRTPGTCSLWRQFCPDASQCYNRLKP